MTDFTELAGRRVSRETLSRLRTLEALLQKWSPAINLVSRASLADLWTRHFVDSLQLFDHCPAGSTTWADFGSGGGFPGLVIAIVAADERPDLTVSLIESDLRKATFLSAAARELGLTVDVRAERIEQTATVCADVVSARALAPLDTLLGYALQHLNEGGRALFLKGSNHAKELEQALAHWKFSFQKVPSKTDAGGVILIIEGISRV